MKGILYLVLAIFLFASAPARAEATLPEYDQAFIDQFQQNPALYENNREALIRFSEQYVLRMYSKIVKDYMVRQNISQVPISPVILKPLFDYDRTLPTPVLWESVRFGSAINTVTATILGALVQYERVMGKPPSFAPPPYYLFDSPGSSPQDVSGRMNALEGRLSEMRLWIYGLAGLCGLLLFTVLGLAFRR